MQYYRLDTQGYYLEPVIDDWGDALPDDITDVPPPQPCWMPRWTGDAWVEDAPMPTALPPDGCVWQWDNESKEWVAAEPEGEAPVYTRAQLEDAVDEALTRQRASVMAEVQQLVAAQPGVSGGAGDRAVTL